MKIRPGYSVGQTKGGMPVLFYKGKLIGSFIWYPIHPVKPIGMILEFGFWTDDSTPRERLEGAIYLWHQIKLPLIGYAREQDNKYFEKLEKLGYCRRTGISHIVFDDQIATVWESTHIRESTHERHIDERDDAESLVAAE